jgi:hypothetical protein
MNICNTSQLSCVLRLALISLSAWHAACGGRVVVTDSKPPGSDPPPADPLEAGSPLGDASVGLDAMSAPPRDAGDGGPADGEGSGAIDAAGTQAVAQCLQAPNAIYVVASGGYGGLNGAFQVTGGEGTWLDNVSFLNNIAFDSPDGGLSFTARAPVEGSGPFVLTPGVTFNSGPGLTAGGAMAQVGLGSACNPAPTGTFTVVDIAFDGAGDSPPLRRFLGSFDLRCGDTGRLVGCARYTK